MFAGGYLMISTKPLQKPIDLKLIDIFTMQERSVLNHAHKEIELIYVVKGTLDVKVREKLYQLNEQDFLIVNSNEPHSLMSNADNLFSIMHFNYLQLSSLLSQENIQFTCNSIENPQKENQKLCLIIEELLSVYLKQPHSSVVEVLEKTLKLVSRLESFYLEKQESLLVDVDSVDKGNSQRLSEILEYVRAHFREPLSLEEVASVQYITVPYLSKFFKKQTGKTFSQYVNKVRLAYAVNELTLTDKSITRIALDNGFPNLAAFNRVFTEHYHEKPIDYRKKKLLDKKSEETKIIVEEAQDTQKTVRELKHYLRTNAASQVHFDLLENSVQEVYTVKAEKAQAFTKYWNKMINLGYATDLLSSDMQEQVALLQKELSFTYGRFWGVFSDEMHIEDYSTEQVSYNFSNVNKVLDFLVNHRLKPFIELGPKPKILSKKFNDSLFLQRSSEKNPEDWRGLIRAFLFNCIERYSVEEVESWYFEIWSHEIDPIQEQEKERSETTKRHDPKQFEEYFQLFSYLKTAINDIIPRAKVGGCGLTMDVEKEKLNLFLREWHKKDVHPDFLSISLYPIEVDRKTTKVNKQNVLSVNPNYMEHKIQQVKHALGNSGFQNLELNATEWNISISNRELLNDSCFKATYITKNIIDNLNGYINIMGYWMCSDIFSDFKDARSLIYGGAGLLTKSGIRKPSYHAFTLLKQLGEILVAKGENYIVTKKSGDRYQVLCFNYKHFDYAYYLSPEGTTTINEQYSIFENNEDLNISIEIQGVSNGTYRIKERKVNRHYGSVLDEWLNFGSVDDIKPDEVEYLKQRCAPYMSVGHDTIGNHAIKLNGKLKPHEVRLYEVTLLIRG